MRTSDWQDFALPLALVFAVAFALTLNRENSAPATGRPGMAAANEPGYEMTVIAKRLPPECRGAVTRTLACDAILAGTDVIVRSGSPREVARASMLDYTF